MTKSCNEHFVCFLYNLIFIQINEEVNRYRIIELRESYEIAFSNNLTITLNETLMVIKILLSLILSFNCALSTSSASVSTVQTLKVAISKHQPKAKIKVFRWKRIFRPIIIFNKKIAFWRILFFGIALILGAIFYFLDKTDSTSSIALDGYILRFLIWILIGIFAISVLIVVVSLIVLPIILIIRILQEIRWQKRYQKCKRF